MKITRILFSSLILAGIASPVFAVEAKGARKKSAPAAVAAPTPAPVPQSDSAKGSAGVENAVTSDKSMEPVGATPDTVTMPATLASPTPTPQVKEHDDVSGVLFIVGRGSGDPLKFRNATYTPNVGTSESFEVSYNTEPATVVGVGIRIRPKSNFGLGSEFGMTLDWARSLKFRERSSNVAPAGWLNDSGESGLWFLTFYGNMIMQFWRFYVPVGVNYPIVGGDGPRAVNAETEGQVGAQLGFGVIITKDFTLEWSGRYLGLRSGEYKGLGGSVELDRGYVFSNTLLLKIGGG